MKIVILGAGAVGCYLGGALAHSGMDVTLIGRERLLDDLASVGQLTLTDYLGNAHSVSSAKVTTSASVLAEADFIILTVKCLGVSTAAEQIKEFSQVATPVLCLQNGIGSEQPLLGLTNPIIRGIVGFNVAPLGKGRFHRGTEGDIICEPCGFTKVLAEAFAKIEVTFKQTNEFEAVRWAKLQLNLNNAINALSNLPLKQELGTHAYRKVLSGAMSELLQVIQAKQLTLPKLTKLPAAWLPRLISVPDFLFTRLASSMLEIDPEARSSMWEDLNKGRQTEIDFINGAVVEEAKTIGISTPINSALCSLIKTAETTTPPRNVSANDIMADIKKRR